MNLEELNNLLIKKTVQGRDDDDDDVDEDGDRIARSSAHSMEMRQHVLTRTRQNRNILRAAWRACPSGKDCDVLAVSSRRRFHKHGVS
jgi:hypothetical protein